eukprot:CAMPEP_0172841976 /NCGR_PEP_ID=MMETSP1075-20121228/30395_1 /TAXON_ID=2916 /ORGANISM="Ceratium fusus, Strain PA161109" /LENGTH=55 /DNA_ID=CAMNT_0013686033 /DNA_START=1 /DNA_END=165 /DNA_ORIENTATION=+
MANSIRFIEAYIGKQIQVAGIRNGKVDSLAGQTGKIDPPKLPPLPWVDSLCKTHA